MGWLVECVYYFLDFISYYRRKKTLPICPFFENIDLSDQNLCIDFLFTVYATISKARSTSFPSLP